MKLELKKIGNSTGLILPRELLAQLDLAQGDWVHSSETSDKGSRFNRSDPDLTGLWKSPRTRWTTTATPSRRSLNERAASGSPVELVYAIHDDSSPLRRAAGRPRSRGLLESALGRPRNRWAYEQGDLCFAWPPPMRSVSPAIIPSSMATSEPPLPP